MASSALKRRLCQEIVDKGFILFTCIVGFVMKDISVQLSLILPFSILFTTVNEKTQPCISHQALFSYLRFWPARAHLQLTFPTRRGPRSSRPKFEQSIQPRSSTPLPRPNQQASTPPTAYRLHLRSAVCQSHSAASTQRILSTHNLCLLSRKPQSTSHRR